MRLTSEKKISRLTRALGIDFYQFIYLLKTSIKLDFRSEGLFAGRQRDSSRYSGLTFTVIIYSFFSLFISIQLLFSRDVRFYTISLLTYSAALLAMAVFMEFGSTILNPEDFQILGARPISSRTYFAVKFSNLLFYVFIINASLNLIPSLIGSLLLIEGRGITKRIQSVDFNSLRAMVQFPPIYFVSSMLMALFTAGVIVSLYSLLMKLFKYEKFRDMLIYLQIVFSLFTFATFQFIPRYLARDTFQGHDFLNNKWLNLFPPVWFAGLVQVLNSRATFRDVLLSFVALVACIVVLFVLLRHLSMDYTGQLSTLMALSHKEERGTEGLGSRLWQRIIKAVIWDQEEHAFFKFLWIMVRRNRQIKLQLYPGLGMMLASFMVLIVRDNDVGIPLKGQDFGLIFCVPLVTFVLTSVSFYSLLAYSDEHSANWIFALTWFRDQGRILTGTNKAIVGFVFAPLFALNLLVLSFFTSFKIALVYSMYGLLGGYAFLQVAFCIFSDIPFTRAPKIAGQSANIGLVLLGFPFIGTLVFVLYLISNSAGLLAVLVSALFLIDYLLTKLSVRIYRRRKLSILKAYWQD